METVSAEVANVNPRERMNFASNSVLGETPKFVDLGLSPANTADKLKSVIGPATRVRRLTDNPEELTSSHGIVKFTADRVSEEKAYSDYIKNSEFETMQVFEFENNSGTQLNQMTQPDQDISQINHESLFNSDSRINPEILINSLIRPTFNIPMTQPTEKFPLTQPTDFELLTQPLDSKLLTRRTEFSEKNEKEHESEVNPDPEPLSSEVR